MLHSKDAHIISDGFISILIGWAHVLYVIWVVLSDGESIGRVTTLVFSYSRKVPFFEFLEIKKLELT